MSVPLFKTSSCVPATSAHFNAALREAGAHDCDILFIHSGMNFGLPAVGRKVLLQELWEAVSSLGVQTLCVPVFTFSFPNNEIFDVENTPSRMGVFGEYIRKLPGAVRSRDPLMSVALIGKQRDLATEIGNESCGRNCTFHKLSERDGVKFAFLGVRAGDCFTYMHHLEWQARIPYRYDRVFHGRIRSEGQECETTAILNVRYKGVVPNDGSYRFEDIMLERGLMRIARFADGTVRCVSEKDATPLYFSLLKQNPNFFLSQPFDLATADDTFEVNGTMVSM